MKILVLALVGLSLLIELALPALAEDFKPNSRLVGTYGLYSGELGEVRPPTKHDLKVAFQIEGKLAQELYSRLPKVPIACYGDAQARGRGDILCLKDKDGLICYFALDSRTGKSKFGVIC